MPTTFAWCRGVSPAATSPEAGARACSGWRPATERRSAAPSGWQSEPAATAPRNRGERAGRPGQRRPWARGRSGRSPSSNCRPPSDLGKKVVGVAGVEPATLSLSIDPRRPLELLQTSIVARVAPLRDGKKTEREGTPKSFRCVVRNAEYLLKQASVNGGLRPSADPAPRFGRSTVRRRGSALRCNDRPVLALLGRCELTEA